jgi:hypothetical protein
MEMSGLFHSMGDLPLIPIGKKGWYWSRASGCGWKIENLYVGNRTAVQYIA